MPVLGAVAPVMPGETGPGLLRLRGGGLHVRGSCSGRNQFHKWAHADQPPRIARWLQRWGVILAPTHHGIHHAAPARQVLLHHRRLDEPVLTRLRFFRRAGMERCGLVWPSLLHLDDRSARGRRSRSDARWRRACPSVDVSSGACPRSTWSRRSTCRSWTTPSTPRGRSWASATTSGAPTPRSSARPRGSPAHQRRAARQRRDPGAARADGQAERVPALPGRRQRRAGGRADGAAC